MNKRERKEVERLQKVLQELTEEFRTIQQALDKRATDLYNKFPDHPRQDTLRYESDNLDSTVDELETTNAFISQALDGIR